MRIGEKFLGRYRVEREIGQGQIGVVYLVEDLVESRKMAIKQLLPLVRGDDQLLRRLRQQAKLTHSLDNDHTLRVEALRETSDGNAYVLMEYLDGLPLSALLRAEARFTPERTVGIARQVLKALSGIHLLEMVHGDLKPKSIFVGQRGGERDQVKVLDFGLTNPHGGQDGEAILETTKFRPGNGVLGTPDYMSPEHSRGEPLTAASDLYALGAILFEMLTGNPPFRNENPIQTLIQHNSSPLPPLPEAVAATPLGHAIRRAMEKDPLERFTSTAQFLEALDAPAAPHSSDPPAALR